MRATVRGRNGMYGKFKFGINIGLGFGESFKEGVSATARAGFDACFTGWNATVNTAERASIIRKSGLIYQSIHAPFNKAAALWEDNAEGDEFLALLTRCLHDCAENDVPIMIVHPIIGMDKHTPNEIGIERFGKLVREAERVGVKIAFENLEGIEYLKAIIAAYNSSPAVGYCWDTGHEMCYNYSQDVPLLFGKKLIATHLNDNFGMTDPAVMTWHDDAHMMPYDGQADWHGIAERLCRSDYHDILTFELTSKSKPNKNTHVIYENLGLDRFLSLVMGKAIRLSREFN